MESPSQVCSQSQCYAVALFGGEGEGGCGPDRKRDVRHVLMYLLLSLIPVDRAELHVVALVSKLRLAVGCQLVDEQDAWGRQLAL